MSDASLPDDNILSPPVEEWSGDDTPGRALLRPLKEIHEAGAQVVAGVMFVASDDQHFHTAVSIHTAIDAPAFFKAIREAIDALEKDYAEKDISHGIH